MDNDNHNNQPDGEQDGAPNGAPKQQLVDRLKSASNILVTVRNNPTVDQLSACIGLTIMLNKLDKHATAVFSGNVPSTIEFLKPEDTLEKNTDSLRDFIIALDKSKADKLRYKVEDKIVKIFITPYKTSISDKDLIFSQGDFNVDAVVALGAHEQTDLDQAITSHGRILHDATVMSINNSPQGNLGSINWEDTNASSLSELVAELAKEFDKNVLDEQISTALLTGIVAETERFSNERTHPETMRISSELMAAGANQQLVAKQLEPAEIPEEGSKKPADIPHDDDGAGDAPKKDDGTLEIEHEAAATPPPAPAEPAQDLPLPEVKLPEPIADATPLTPEPLSSIITPSGSINDLPPLPPPPEIPHIRQLHNEPMLPSQPQPLSAATSGESEHESEPEGGPAGDNLGFVSEPPAMGGMLTANSTPETEEGSSDPFSVPPHEEQKALLHRDEPVADPEPQPAPTAPAAAAPAEPPTASEPPAAPPQPEPSAPAAPTPPALPVASSPVTDTNEADTDADAPTLIDIEESVHSPHLQQAAQPEPLEPDVASARDEVMRALNQGPPSPLEPIAALNAQPLGDELHDTTSDMPQVHVDQDGNLHLPSTPSGGNNTPVGIDTGPETPPEAAPGSTSPADQPLTMPLPPSSSFSLPPAQAAPPTNSPNSSQTAPPPVPPPLMPPPQP